MESAPPLDVVRARLLRLAEERGVSLASLSRMIGKNASYLQQFVRKGSPRKLEEQDRATLARFFGVDEVALERPKDNSSDGGGTGTDLSREYFVDIPRLAIGASAGPGRVVENEAAFDAIGFSPRWLRAMGFQPRLLATLAVSGDSMEPALRDGDEILVDRSVRPLRDGIHLVRLGDVLLVKRIDTTRPDVLTLISDNISYPPIECSPQDVQVIGRVVWKGGRI